MKNRLIQGLLVEDNPADALLTRQMLADSDAGIDFNLVHKDSLEEGLKTLKQVRFDVILLDLSLPDSRGLETVTRARRPANETPIIVFTGMNDQELAVKAVQYGAQDYLVKGQINSEILLRVIRYAIERKKLMKELVKSQKLESIGMLAGGIAHDFNNILTAIMGNIELAKMHAGSESRITKLLGESEMSVARARDLTNQLLTFSQGGAPVKKTIAVGSLIKEVIKVLSASLDIRCESSVSEDIRGVEIDELQMSQVLKNLITNAHEAMEHDGVIHIDAGNVLSGENLQADIDAQKFVRISISDSGDGIPDELLDRIFDPFFSGNEEHAGLGLAICHSIIKQHGGHITVDSETGKGSTFHILLPARCEGPHQEGPPHPEAKPGRGRLLIMDDDAGIRKVMEDILDVLGYEAEMTDDGEKAIKLYKKARACGDPFDVVILDLVVPDGMGGKDTIKQLKKIDPGVKAVVSSGYCNDPVMSDYRGHGFSAVLPKPYKISLLSEILHELIPAAR
jgi:signal transduction histidine kinase